MKKLTILLLLILVIPMSASALDFTAPTVPSDATDVMPDSYDSFGEGLWYILRTAFTKLQPSLAEACGICLSLVSVMLLICLAKGFAENQTPLLHLVGTVMIGCLLFRQSQIFVNLCANVVSEISAYGRLLLPVMAASLAAQGGATSSAALYGGTVLFDAVLTGAITKLLIPLVYVYLSLALASSALENESLKELKALFKWLITWSLKIILYVFTGYIAITGVVSGTADAAAIKAVKITLSGFVPVVGSIIADASETILVSAGVMKSAVGIYGLLAIGSVMIGPFLQITVEYVLLKAVTAVCGVIGGQKSSGLIRDFCTAMGFLLAMIGTVSVMLLISVVCFMKGVG